MLTAWSNLALGLAALFSPVAAALLVLVRFDYLGAGPAWIAGGVILIAMAALCRWHFAKIAQVVRYAHAAAENRPTPAAPDGPVVGEISEAVDRLHRALAEERRRAADHAGEESVIFDIFPDPMLLLDAERRVVRTNEAAAQLAGSSQVGGDLAMVLRHPMVLEAVDAVLSGRAASREAEFMLPVPQARHFNARVLRSPRTLGANVAAMLVLHDLTEIKRAEQMRSDFVANASHELRTPLTTLIGFIETLQGPAKDDPPARERFLRIMREHAERMSRLIRDLLALSQIEMLEHSPPQTPVDLPGVTREVAELLEMQASAKNMTIEVMADSDLPPAIGDRDQLIQVFQNLIDNAIKYGRPGTPIKVNISRSAETAGRSLRRPGERPALAVAVSDQSDGIPREHLTRLTERFYRVDSARSRALGGTGLGLAIVKHVVSRHRGALAIDSDPGQGSTFTVYLPSA